VRGHRRKCFQLNACHVSFPSSSQGVSQVFDVSRRPPGDCLASGRASESVSAWYTSEHALLWPSPSLPLTKTEAEMNVPPCRELHIAVSLSLSLSTNNSARKCQWRKWE